MATAYLFVAGAVASSFGLAYLLGKSAHAFFQGGISGGTNSGYQRGHRFWYLRNGVRATRGVARWLLRIPGVTLFTNEGVLICKLAHLETNPVSLLSVYVALLCVIGGIVALATASLLSALAVCACLTAFCCMYLNSRRDAREEATREALPEVLRSMEICFQSGFTLLQTFRQIEQETTGALHYLFDRAARRLELGESASSALAVFRENSAVSGLSFVSIALDVQHQAGGSIASVLESARSALRDELDLRRSLRVQTAQAKLSARVVTILPFVLIALFSLVSEGFLQPFFASPLGWMLLAIAFAMQLGGILLVRRMLAVEVN